MSPTNYILFTGRLMRYNQVRSYVSTCLSYRDGCHIFFGKCKQMKAHYPMYIQKLVFKDSRSKLRCFSTIPDKEFLQKQRTKVTKEFKNYIEHNKELLRDTEQRIKDRGNIILQDIKDTKDKVKGKVEEIIERDNMYTIPNFLCVLRILLSPYLGLLIIQSNFNLALGVLGVAAITDLLDGWIARTWVSQSSKMGSFLDPMADKVLIATLFLSLTYADLIPLLLTSIIIGRDVLLIAAGFVIRYRSLPPPRTLSRYFDVTHATVQLAPTFISKVNTAVQLVLVGSTMAAPIFAYVDHPLLQALWYVTGATTIAAGASYVISKNTYKFVKREKTK